MGTPTLSGVIHAAVLYEAKQKGVDPASTKGVEAPSPNLPDQLKAGRIDAVEALEPFASQLSKQGNVSLGDPFSPIADPLATNFWMAQGEWARGHQDIVRRFVDSMTQARTFIEQNPVEARKILQGYTNLPVQVASSVPLPTYDFTVRKDDLSIWVNALRDIGQFNGTWTSTNWSCRRTDDRRALTTSRDPGAAADHGGIPVSQRRRESRVQPRSAPDPR